MPSLAAAVLLGVLTEVAGSGRWWGSCVGLSQGILLPQGIGQADTRAVRDVGDLRTVLLSNTFGRFDLFRCFRVLLLQ